MPITLDGTLGITTPALTVTGATVNTGGISTAGNLTFTSTGQRIIGEFASGTFANRVFFQNSTTNASTSISAMPNGTGTSSSYVAYGTSDPANANRMYISISASDASVRSDITGTGTYQPMTFYTGGSERMRIDTSGNVGIGTSSPATKAEIYGTAAASNLALRITNTATDGYSTLQMGDANAGVYRNGSAQSGYAGASSLNLITVGAHNIGFSTGNTLRAVIDSSGNVGIGTSSPAVKLQVSANSGYVESRVTSGTNDVGLAIDGSNAYLAVFDAIPLQFQTNATERMRIASNGAVLVGSTSLLSSSSNFQINCTSGGGVGGANPTPSVMLNYSAAGGGGSFNTLCLHYNTSTVGNGSALTFSGLDSAGSRYTTALIGTVLTANTAAAPSANLVFNTLSAGALNETMKIDFAGRVTMPYQPAFYAYISTSGSVNGVIPFNSVQVNIGSYYNTSTYRFTAPVAGTYYFSVGLNTNTTAGSFYFRKNGSGTVNGSNANTGGISTWTKITTDVMLTLAAGDYIEAVTSGSYNYDSITYNFLTGWLIG
jgi:hypothetical protein